MVIPRTYISLEFVSICRTHFAKVLRYNMATPPLDLPTTISDIESVPDSPHDKLTMYKDR